MTKEKFSLKLVNLEHEQSLVRVLISTLIIVGFLVYGLTYPSFQQVPESVHRIYFEMPIFLGVALILSLHCQYYPQDIPERKYFGILIDNLQCAIGMIIGGPYAAIIFFVYTWVTVGNGIRFGYRYMIVSAAMSVACCFVGMIYSDYWRSNAIFVYGVMITNFIVPCYIYGLLKRIESNRKQLESYAEQMRVMAFHDGLTGLANRGLLQETASKALDRAIRSRTCMALVYFDLDGFKQVNDTHGHEIGDLLLKQVADISKNRVRSNDTVARLGGDEFAMVLEGLSSEQGAILVSNDILNLIGEINHVYGADVKVGASFGIALFNPVTDIKPDAKDMIKKADEAMYMAKRAGKNRVALYRAEDIKDSETLEYAIVNA